MTTGSNDESLLRIDNSPLDESEKGSSKALNEQENGVSNISQAKWINNQGEEVYDVFGFNKNAELVNGRAAMIGFLMLILTEIIFHGDPVTKSIFGFS